VPKTAGEALAVAARRQTAEGLGTAAALLRGHSGTLAQARVPFVERRDASSLARVTPADTPRLVSATVACGLGGLDSAGADVSFVR